MKWTRKMGKKAIYKECWQQNCEEQKLNKIKVNKMIESRKQKSVFQRLIKHIIGKFGNPQWKI